MKNKMLPFAICHLPFARRGQVMILAILALGGVILVGTTAAGLLVIYQIRQSADIANSAKAVFAADSGIEWGLYQFFSPSFEPLRSDLPPLPLSFSNGASVNVACYDGDSPPNKLPSCDDNQLPPVKFIRTIGKSGNVSRAFEQSF